MVKPKRMRGQTPKAEPTAGFEDLPAEPQVDQGIEKGRCPRRWGWLVCCLVALHVLAVLAEPLRFFSQSDVQAGPEFAAMRQLMAPYVEWLSLDHGYFFFAPNPGPSHLVAVRVVSPPPVRSSSATRSGSVTRSGSEGPVALEEFAYLFPDRNRQWPRLLYHRYFMLSEFYNNSFAPSALLEEDRIDTDFVQRWSRDRAFYTRLGKSIADSFSYSLGVDRVELIRLERELFSTIQVLREGWRLDDPRGLMELLESPEEPPPVAAEELTPAPATPPAEVIAP